MHLKHHFVSELIISLVHLQVGHVQQVSLVPDRTHEMKTISLKPLLFGKCTVDFGEYLLFMNKWHFIRISNTAFNFSQSHTNIDQQYLLKIHRYVHFLLNTCHSLTSTA